MSYVLVIYLSLFPVPMESFSDENECLKMALKVNEYLVKTSKAGKAWCIKDSNVKT